MGNDFGQLGSGTDWGALKNWAIVAIVGALMWFGLRLPFRKVAADERCAKAQEELVKIARERLADEREFRTR